MSKRIDGDELEAAERPRRRSDLEGERRRVRRQRRRGRRIAPFIALGLIVFVCFIAFTMVRARTLNPVVGMANFMIADPGSAFGKQRLNVLVLGLDYDYNDLDIETSANARTDKIEAFALDFPTKVVKSVGVPRDLDAIVDGHEDKINAAYQNGGWKATDKLIGPLLGLKPNEHGTYFDRYIVLRINASKDVIDAIGGITVPVTETINYDDNWGHLHIHFKPGIVHMNGDQAVSYARFRHDACSDPCRIRRQQQVEHLVIEKLRNEKFNDITHISSLIDVIRRDVDTNLTIDEMKSLGWGFRDVNMADIHSTVIPYVTDKVLRCCGDVLIADDDALKQIGADFTGSFAAVAPPPPLEAVAAVKPSEISLTVLNGTGVTGLAKRAAGELRAEGYKVHRVGNADSSAQDATEILTHTKVQYAGDRVKSDLRLDKATIAASTPDDTEVAAASDVTVIIGKDYLLRPPRPVHGR